MVNSERGAGAGVVAHPHGGGGHRSDEWWLSRARADDRSQVTGTRHYVTAGYRLQYHQKANNELLGLYPVGDGLHIETQ